MPKRFVLGSRSNNEARSIHTYTLASVDGHVAKLPWSTRREPLSKTPFKHGVKTA